MVSKSVLALLPGDQLLGLALAKVQATESEAQALSEFFAHLKGSYVGGLLPDSPGSLVKMLVGGSVVGGPIAEFIADVGAFPGAKGWLAGQVDRLVSSFAKANEVVGLLEKFQKEGLLPAGSEEASVGAYLADLVLKDAPEAEPAPNHVAHTCPKCGYAHIVNF